MSKALRLLVLAVTLVACEPDATALTFDRDPVVVHSVLEAGATSAAVLVARIQRNAAPGDGVTGVPVTDAQVRLIAGTDTVILTRPQNGRPCRASYQTPPADASVGCYTAELPAGVQAGSEYRLLIRLADGTLIRGATTVPHAPVFTQPTAPAELHVPRTPGGEVSTDTLQLAWSGAAAAARLEVRVMTVIRECGVTLRHVTGLFGSDIQYSGLMAIDVTGRQSASIAGYMIACAQNVTFDRGPGSLMLTAYDANYSRYVLNRTRARPLHEAAAGIDGAWGVFGALATAHRDVTIVAR
jgi:hypothetical protein